MKQTRSLHERLSVCAAEETSKILQDLQVPSTGLTPEQAEEHRKRYGENIFVEEKRESVPYRLRRAFVNPFSMVLLLLAAITLVTDVLLPADYGRNVSTVTIIVVMLLVSGVIRFTQELRSKQVADRLVRLVGTTVQVMRQGVWQETESEELAVGDLVRLEAGARVPAAIRH